MRARDARSNAVARWLWWNAGAGARVARIILAPASAIFWVIVRVRNALYDRGALRVFTPPIPVISVGNIVVGGTGKTPLASWLAQLLDARGVRPAIILRGYGNDEPRVHETLTPTIRVIANPDRVAAVKWATESGATVAVLDDGFQHRRLARSADVVLLSADAAPMPVRLLPAGPYREPFAALRRASLVIITRKAASFESAQALAARARAAAPRATIAIVHLTIEAVHFRHRPSIAPGALKGKIVRAIAAVGDGRAFLEQMLSLAGMVQPRLYPDHHAFTAADVEELTRDLPSNVIPLCTLKDAVKLFPLWPREAPPIGYVSQAVIVEEGGDSIDALLDLLITSRLRQL